MKADVTFLALFHEKRNRTGRYESEQLLGGGPWIRKREHYAFIDSVLGKQAGLAVEAGKR